MRTFDRRQEFDERSREYSIRTLLGDAPTLQTKVWDIDVWLDQGSEGACVGYSFAHEIAAEPVPGDVDGQYARHIYFEAQKVDQWPGEDYSGTSVLAGAKTVATLGWFDEYRWAFSIDDALASLSNIGPAVFGTNWYEGMYDTDADGYIHRTGNLAGGHAILALGYDHEKQAVLLHNSWGPGWGENGRAWLSVEDFTTLMYEFGEFCIPLVRADINAPVEPEPVEPEPVEPEPVEPEPVEPEPVEPEPQPQQDFITRFINWLLDLITSWFSR